MEKRRIFLDTSSHLWANLLVGKDEDNGYYERDSAGKERFTNSWKFGLDNALRNMAKILKRQVVPRSNGSRLQGWSRQD